MKIINLILLALLVILSIATGVTKLIQLPDEMLIFRNAGYSDPMIILFGVVQVVGGLLLIPATTRKGGAIVMAISFVLATIVLFQNGMTAFGLFSLLFIALASWQIYLAVQRDKVAIA